MVHFDGALRALRALGHGSGQRDVIRALCGGGEARRRLGRLAAAAEDANEAVAAFDRRASADPAAHAAALRHAARVRRDQGELVLAEGHLIQAVHVLLARGGAAGAAGAAQVRLELAGLYGAAGRSSEALAECLAAEASLEGIHPSENGDVAAAMWATGAALVRAGRPQDALSQLHRAQHALAAASGSDHPDVAGVLQEIGGVLDGSGSGDAALARFEEALEIYSAAGSLEGVAAVSNDMAIIFRKQGRHAEALAR